MKENEAIERIKSGICNEIGTAKYCHDNCMHGTEYCAYSMAIEALEKQVPKKVVPRHIRKYDGFDDGECPTCGNFVLRDGFSNDIYCDECGQKLDWEGGE